jgi:hypothetical protein
MLMEEMWVKDAWDARRWLVGLARLIGSGKARSGRQQPSRQRAHVITNGAYNRLTTVLAYACCTDNVMLSVACNPISTSLQARY